MSPAASAKAQSTASADYAARSVSRGARARLRIALSIAMLGLIAACATGRGEGENADGTASADSTGDNGRQGEIVTGELQSRARDELAVFSQPAGLVTLASSAAGDPGMDASAPVSIAGLPSASDSAEAVEPEMIPDSAPGALIIARTWPDRQQAAAATLPPVDATETTTEATTEATVVATADASSGSTTDAPIAAPGFVGRVLGWFSSEGSVVGGEGESVVGLASIPAPVLGNDGFGDRTASMDQPASTDQAASVERPQVQQTTLGQVASVRSSAPVEAFDLSALERGGFAAILGAMHGLVERCGENNRVREDALKEFSAAYPMLDLDRRDAASSQPSEARARVDETFARTSGSLQGRAELNCDYVRLQTIAWTELANDLRRMSPDSASQYKAGLITEVQRGAGLGGF